MHRTIIVTDRVASTGSASWRSVDSASSESVKFREISLCVDESDDMISPPSLTWKMITGTKSDNETPSLQGLWRVPLEFTLPMTQVDDSPMLGELPTIRNEVGERAMLLPLHTEYLQAARAAITEASHNPLG